jgi:hypothetical protein
MMKICYILVCAAALSAKTLAGPWTIPGKCGVMVAGEKRMP